MQGSVNNSRVMVNKLFAILILFTTGCTAVVHELKAPPHPYVVMHQMRGVGIEATIPSQTGDSVVKFRLGFFSDAIHLIPCATNQMFIPAIANSFKLGSEISLSPTTTIVEDVTTGWSGTTPPPPRFNRLFEKPAP